ncbi:MAG TPA: hypothetical protein VGR34_06590 [Candidatus Dormibacteraeota bacterium]|nr:hypothetical protein [Candidatus Dormibacteraeota bacterium]
MIYTLATPVNVGDFNKPLLIDKLELSAVSINLDIADPAKAVLSIVLIHRASGWKLTIIYEDATSRSFWNSLNTANAVTQAAFTKMVADGKLPAGVLA